MKPALKWFAIFAILAISVFPTIPTAFAGAPGSGWKPDKLVRGYTTEDRNPSMATDSLGNLYVAFEHYRSGVSYPHEIRICKSTNQGVTWSYIATISWYYNLYNPSIAVDPYDDKWYVAFLGYGGVDSHYIVALVRSGDANKYVIDYPAASVSPHLTIEYQFGAFNYLYVSYEKQRYEAGRDLYVARSTNHGVSWTKTMVRGGIFMSDVDMFEQSSITNAQRNVYVAYRHKAEGATGYHIDVSYSTNYGINWTHAENVSAVSTTGPGFSGVFVSHPCIAASHYGPNYQPTAVMVAYEYCSYTFWGLITNYDVLVAWSEDYGATWSGGYDNYHHDSGRMATNANERRPVLTVDGMGSTSTNVGGNFHLAFWKQETEGDRINGIYYTQLQFWDTPTIRYGYSYGYNLGWSHPYGQIIDNNGNASFAYPAPAMTTYQRSVGGEMLWMPAVTWTDGRNSATLDLDIYYSTPATEFKITWFPPSQSVVEGGSIGYYITVHLLAGPVADATWGGSIHSIGYPGGGYYFSSLLKMEYDESVVTPTHTSTLTLDVSSLFTKFRAPGNYWILASATIGGYRRIVRVPFTVLARPTLSLEVSPTTVARESLVTISGQLTPGLTTKIYLFYRYPHITGSWKLATEMYTNAAGAYSVSATVPNYLSPGTYDLVAVWFDATDGSYAVSPIKTLNIT